MLELCTPIAENVYGFISELPGSYTHVQSLLLEFHCWLCFLARCANWFQTASKFTACL